MVGWLCTLGTHSGVRVLSTPQALPCLSFPPPEASPTLSAKEPAVPRDSPQDGTPQVGPAQGHQFCHGGGDSSSTHGCPSSMGTGAQCGRLSPASLQHLHGTWGWGGHGDMAASQRRALGWHGDKPWQRDHPDLCTQQTCTRMCTHTYMPECTHTTRVCTQACTRAHARLPNNAHIWCTQAHICTLGTATRAPHVPTPANTHPQYTHACTHACTPAHGCTPFCQCGRVHAAHTCARGYAPFPSPPPTLGQAFPV